MSSQHIHQAIILGAGYGGLGQGAQLVRDGIDDFLILEKSTAIGGVWRDNTYPGAACDTQTPIYCYSYFLHLSATKMYAGQPELLQYLHDLAAEYELDNRIRLGHDVVAAAWDEHDKVWSLRTEDGVEFRCRAFIPAWGQLSAPQIPDLPGASCFEGTRFHSARWRHDIRFAGARVASIGNAASAVQYIPALAPLVAHLTVFQRSANYILPRDQRAFTDIERARFAASPATYREMREEIHSFREDGFTRTRLGTSDARAGADQARAHLFAQVADPQLRADLTPDYEFGCKRILRSDDYYPALTRENVDLVSAPIEAITSSGVRTSDGVDHAVDIIIYGTGFQSQSFQGQLRINGRGGITLDERWGNSPEAHLGITVDGFPNMFLVYGPNTNLNHNSVVTMLEAQHRYIASCVQHLGDDPKNVLEVDPVTLRVFNERVQDELKSSAFSADCSSWYKNADGRVINNWCGTADEYHTVTDTIELSDFGIRV